MNQTKYVNYLILYENSAPIQRQFPSLQPKISTPNFVVFKTQRRHRERHYNVLLNDFQDWSNTTVPEFRLGADFIGRPKLHAVSFRGLIGCSWKGPPHHLVLVKLLTRNNEPNQNQRRRGEKKRTFKNSRPFFNDTKSYYRWSVENACSTTRTEFKAAS